MAINSPDSERVPVISCLAAFEPANLMVLDQFNPNTDFAKGVQFGLGSGGSKPISNFTGRHFMRPLVGQKRMPKISVSELITNLEAVRDNIARVTIKTGLFTDIEALRETIQALRETVGKSTQLVVSASDLVDLSLIMAQDVGDPDLFQYDAGMTNPRKADEIVRQQLRTGKMIPDIEVSIPMLATANPSLDTMKLMEVLGKNGHNTHVGYAIDPCQLGMATDTVTRVNDYAKHFSRSWRATGVYASASTLAMQLRPDPDKAPAFDRMGS